MQLALGGAVGEVWVDLPPGLPEPVPGAVLELLDEEGAPLADFTVLSDDTGPAPTRPADSGPDRTRPDDDPTDGPGPDRGSPDRGSPDRTRPDDTVQDRTTPGGDRPVGHRVRGSVRPLRPDWIRHPGFARPARDVAATLAEGTVGVAVTAPLSPRQVAGLRALTATGTPVLLLALVGTGRPRPLDGAALIRTLVEAAGPAPAPAAGSREPADGTPAGRRVPSAVATIVAVPLQAHPDLDPTADAALVAAVLAAHGIRDSRLPADLAGLLTEDQPAGTLTEPTTEPTTGPPTGPVSELVTGPVSEHVTETVTGPVTNSPAGVPGTPGPRLTALPVLPVLARELARTRPGEGGRGAVVLFTGLSGSGKSTIAKAVADALAADGTRTATLLDGDVVRRSLSSGLGFSRADRDRNVTRIGFVAALVARHGGIALAAPIAPYARTRAAVRAQAEEVGDFVLVHVATPLAVCEARDRKGLYAAARRGDIAEFTGVSDPYEVPTDADLVLDTAVTPVQDSVQAVLGRLRTLGHLP